MSSITQKSGLGVAQLLLFFSISVLVIVVAVPVLLILFNAFWVDGEFNLQDVVKIILEPDTYQALVNSLIIASGTTLGSTIVGCQRPKDNARVQCPEINSRGRRREKGIAW